MLNNLYRKLHILFASSCYADYYPCDFLCRCEHSSYRENQRKHLISEIDNLADLSSGKCFFGYGQSTQNLRRELSYFSLITDTRGNTIYQSDFPFPTSADNLLHDVEKQISTQPLSQIENSTTSQGGFLEIRGTHHDTYFVIPATIRTANDTVYHATFLYQTASLTDILQKTLPILSFLFWFLACIVVIVLTRYLAEKVVCSNGTNTAKPKILLQQRPMN